MASEQKRFTVSIPADMESDLAEVKKGLYLKETQSEMIRDLISRGLNNLKANDKGTRE